MSGLFILELQWKDNLFQTRWCLDWEISILSNRSRFSCFDWRCFQVITQLYSVFILLIWCRFATTNLINRTANNRIPLFTLQNVTWTVRDVHAVWVTSKNVPTDSTYNICLEQSTQKRIMHKKLTNRCEKKRLCILLRQKIIVLSKLSTLLQLSVV